MTFKLENFNICSNIYSIYYCTENVKCLSITVVNLYLSKYVIIFLSKHTINLTT